MRTYSSSPGESEKRSEVSCDLCGGRRYRGLYAAGPVVFVRCSECGLVFQNPQPAPEDLVSRYSDHYFEYEIENEKQFFNLMLLALGDVRFFSESPTGETPFSFLDIGCATGMLLEHLRDGRGWEVQGVEVCKAAADFGIRNRNLSIFTGTLEDARFEDKSFDAVHASHVIEHLSSPKAFLKETNRILKDDGYLIVTTPNIAGFQSKLFGRNWRSAIPDHMFLFSKRSLKRLLGETGFSVIRRKTWGGLAGGTAPPTVKKIADRLVKIIGAGDVMVYLSRKETVP